MPPVPVLLLVEPDADRAGRVTRTLADADLEHRLEVLADPADLGATVRRLAPCLVLAAADLAGHPAEPLMREARAIDPDLGFIFLAPDFGGEQAIEAMRQGADDYLTLDHLDRLPVAVLRCMARRQQAREFQASVAYTGMLTHILLDSSQPFGQGFPDGRLGFHNQALLDLVGYTEAEFVQLDWNQDLTPPEWREIERIKLQEMHMTGEPAVYEKEYRHKDGHRIPVEMRVHLVRKADGTPDYYYAFVNDISRQRSDMNKLELLARRADALLALPSAAERMNEVEFMQYGQELAEKLTESQIAFIHFVNEDQESIELVAWSKRTLSHYCQAAYDRHYPISQAGIWADAMRQKRAVVFNDYASTPHKHGLPEGHAPLIRLISVPVIEAGQVRMMAGVGNRATAYSDLDVETVQLIANEIWHIVQRRRSQVQAARFSQALAGSVNEVYLFASDSLRFVDANRGALTNTGYSHDELLALTPLDLKPGFDEAGFRAWLAPLLAGTTPRLRLTTSHRRKDGSSYPVEINAELTGDQPPLVLASVLDISDRLANEAQLRQLSQAVEQSPASVVITDLEARILYANPAFTRISGYPLEEVLGHNPRLLHSGKTPATTYAELWATLTRGDTWQGEFINQRKNGEEYIEWATISPVRQADGQVSHYLAIKQDITRQKNTELELANHRQHLEAMVEQRTREAEHARLEAERLARVKSDFLANMSHEIRTPLNAVLGFAQIGARDCPDEASRTTFARILDAGQILLGVVNDILDYTKMEAGKLELDTGIVNLAEVIERACGLVRERAREKGLAFRVGTAADLPAACRGDGLRLTQVLGNLLSNAVKFTERGAVTFTASQDGEQLVFRVADTGIGMSADQVGRLFKPFEQADNSTTRRFGGTGLGLAISQRLLAMMGGEIRVDSQPGRGSTFEIRVPLVDPAGRLAPLPAPAQAVAVPAERLDGLRLLVVEDNAVNRLVLQDMLHRLGCRIDQAEQGQQAVERVRAATEAPYDLVLMDIQMPVMDGYDATREIHRLAPGLPVIGLTAHALPEDQAKCLAAGMVEHLAKPIALPALVDALRRHAPPRTRLTPPPPAPVTGAPVGDERIDWPTLEARYAGREAFLQQLMRTCLETQAGRPEHLRLLADQGQRDELGFIAHGLKGLAGDLLPGSVRQLAAEVETALREQSPEAWPLARHLADRLAAVLDEIRGRLADPAETEPGPATPARWHALKPQLVQLEALLDSSDTRALELLRELRTPLRQTVGPRADSLIQAIELFDFEAALHALRPLLAEAPEATP
ncbi:MAG: PAS domain S-box protein [Pseudomonadota bacterium]